MNLEQLKAQRDALDAQIKQAMAAERNDAIRAAKKLIADFELSARDLGLSVTTTRRSGDARAVVAPKYRDPQNPDNTWTGRGKMPRWLDQAVRAGKDREFFRI